MKRNADKKETGRVKAGEIPHLTTAQKVVSNRIKQLLKINNMTQKQFAEKCGLSADTLSRATKHGKLSISCAKIIAEHMNVSLDFLFGADDTVNFPQKALNIFKEHTLFQKIKIKIDGKYFWVDCIEVSPALDKYIKSIYEIRGSAVILNSDNREKIQQQVDDELLENIEKDFEHGEFQSYYLVDDTIIREAGIYNQLKPVSNSSMEKLDNDKE